jgi:hypothetical protein
MTRLLVSVRNRTEALLALRTGVDLIDVKEPARGPLGAADWEVVDDVIEAVSGAVPVSMALGELTEYFKGDMPRVPEGVGYAKLGLAGCARWDDWPVWWMRAFRRLPHGTQTAAVAYADWAHAAAPEPARVIEEAGRAGCRAVLVDTWGKSKGSLVELWRRAEIAAFVGQARRVGLMVLLAGSLSAECLPSVVTLAPDFVAVRGAACRGGRSGPLDPGRLGELVRIVRGEASSAGVQ